MRILLIKPAWKIGYGQVRYGKNVRFPSLALGIVAALSGTHDVEVVDANWKPIPYGRPFDLVGITSTTFTADDAYRIAARFRALGTPVVLGGVHPSIRPEEALSHADAVVVGEAETTWPQVLEDAQRGTLQGIYRAEVTADMRLTPRIRRDLLGEHSWFTAVEASRGCPNKCSYCYLPSTPWAAHRYRPVEQVVDEIRSLRQRLFIFIDDNLFADRDYALELFRRIAPLKKSWLIQAPTTIGKDDEMLDAMAAAGCFNIQLGFQSFNNKTLKLAKVHHNRVESYRTLVDKLHDRHIVVTGYFVFGFDTDGPDVFETTVKTIEELKIDDAGMFVATPFPGTKFREKFKREGRLLDVGNSSQYGWMQAVFQPKNMTPEQLEQGVQWAYDALQSHFRRRLLWVLRTQTRLLVRAPQMVPTLLFGNLRNGGNQNGLAANRSSRRLPLVGAVRAHRGTGAVSLHQGS